MLPDLTKHTLTCRICGYEQPLMETKLYTEGILKPKQTLVINSHAHTTKKECSKCGNNEAYFWRSGRSKENAPEPSNVFYKCTKCGYAWKEM